MVEVLLVLLFLCVLAAVSFGAYKLVFGAGNRAQEYAEQAAGSEAAPGKTYPKPADTGSAADPVPLGDPVSTDTPVSEDPGDVIIWKDEKLKLSVIRATGILDREITYEDALEVLSMDLSGCDLTDITELQYFTNLKYLELEGNPIVNFRPLSGLTQLVTLNLNGTAIGDLSCLTGMTELENLYLEYNGIGDITPLKELNGLKVLSLKGNRLASSSIDSLTRLEQLTELSLATNNIYRVDGLEALTGLEILDLSHNNISDVSTLAKLPNLTALNLAYNEIEDLSALEEARAYDLKEFDATGNPGNKG